MEGPLNSLRFLIGHLQKNGEVLKAGEMVIPGSATALIPVEAGEMKSYPVACHLGSVTASFN